MNPPRLCFRANSSLNANELDYTDRAIFKIQKLFDMHGSFIGQKSIIMRSDYGRPPVRAKPLPGPVITTHFPGRCSHPLQA